MNKNKVEDVVLQACRFRFRETITEGAHVFITIKEGK